VVSLNPMRVIDVNDFPEVYANFNKPILDLDCGKKCAPYNELGIPFCCDTRHTVPTAYELEWEQIKPLTDLWHIWQADSPEEMKGLQDVLPDGQVLLECTGFLSCQRPYRLMACRAFPFYPYLSSNKEFMGISFYWEYRDRCWIISNLDQVSKEYTAQFIETNERIFLGMPEELENFCYHSADTRRLLSQQRRRLTLLHRDGNIYTINPKTEEMRLVRSDKLPKFGPYRVAADLLFSDEM